MATKAKSSSKQTTAKKYNRRFHPEQDLMTPSIFLRDVHRFICLFFNIKGLLSLCL